MEFAGITLNKPRPKYLVVPHQDLPGGQMPLQISYLPDVDEFLKLFPEPVPKSTVQRPGMAAPVPNKDDPKYKAELQEYYLDMQEWCILASIDARDKDGNRLNPCEDTAREFAGPKFSTISISDRATLRNWEKEMLEAGFSNPVLQRIRNEVYERTGLNQNMIDRLTDSFLSSRGINPADNR